jgi:hypothetical protein
VTETGQHDECYRLISPTSALNLFVCAKTFRISLFVRADKQL